MKKPKINIERLKEKRLEKGWNKMEAAEFMAMPHSVYLRYESGERSPSYTALRDMALTLGTSVEYLTGQTDDDRPIEYLIPADDDRLLSIIEIYKGSPEDARQRLYKYASKLSE